MKRQNVTVTVKQVQTNQRYTYTLLNSKLPKSNGSREISADASGEHLLDPTGLFQHCLNSGWKLIELKQVTVNMFPDTQNAIENVLQCYDALLNAIADAKHLVDTEHDAYKQQHDKHDFDSTLNALSMNFDISAREINRMRKLFCFDAHIK
jgi:hypothetical protein